MGEEVYPFNTEDRYGRQQIMNHGVLRLRLCRRLQMAHLTSEYLVSKGLVVYLGESLILAQPAPERDYADDLQTIYGEVG